MTERPKCSRCGAELPASAPGGHCLKCLFQLGLEANTVSETLSAEKSGDRIGAYKLVEQIGEGGCGVVYMAEQEQPVRRRVALKIIKLGMDTKQVIARFEAERQALALMEHPNIARVFDAGATDAGRPYFVMELVQGSKITEYYDAHRLTIRQRLDLFVQVCQAVQHAHQKGVIHRDLKPSNILVTEQDGRAVPKIIDFGIAKATTDQRLTDKTLFTAFEIFIGTPAYMSPEQASMGGMDVDTRSDIYSLGVLLYELLCGQPLFDAATLQRAAFEEVLNTIRKSEPARPTVRVMALTAKEATEVASRRKTEPAKLPGLFRGELDWIVMKTLEKDRSRRYATANGLAQDVVRFLNGEAVIAKPPSNWYQFQKMVIRNKLLFTAGAAVTLAVGLGLIVSSWEAVRATHAERKADEQKNRAEFETVTAQRARQKTSEAFSSLMLVEGERLTKDDAASKALAYYASALRLNPSNRVATARIVTLLSSRNFPLPLISPPKELVDSQAASDRSRSFQFDRSPEDLVFAFENGVLSNRQTGERISTIMFAGQMDRKPVYSHDFEKMAILTMDNIEVFYTKTGKPVLPPIMAKHTGSAPYLMFTPDDRSLLVGGKSTGVLEVWDLVQPELSRTNFQHASTVWSMAISADGRLLASGVRNGVVRFWDMRTGQPYGEPCPGITDIVGAALTRDGNFLAARIRSFFSSGEREMEVFWDVRPGRAIPVTLWHPAGVRNASYSPDGNLIFTLCNDGTVRLWQPETGALLQQPRLTDGKAQSVTFSPDSRFLVLGGLKGTLGLWDIAAQRMLYENPICEFGITKLLVSPDNKQIVCAGGSRLAPSQQENTVVKLVDSKTGSLLKEIKGDHGSVMSLAFSRDSRKLAIAYRLYTVDVWDVEKMTQLGESLQANHGWVWDACFSHDGKWLATSSGGNATQIWDATMPTNKPVEFYPHGNGVRMARFSSDDKLLLTCANDHTARVWNRETSRPIAEPMPFTSFNQSGEFASGDREVLTASSTGVTLWDVQSGKAFFDILANNGDLTGAQLNPGGTELLAASQDGTVRIYSLEQIPDASPAWLPKLAEVVGGYRLNEENVIEIRTNAAQEIVNLRNLLGKTNASAPLVHWARWYLSDRNERPINANSKITVRDYAATLTTQPYASAINEAMDLNPTDYRAYAKLAHIPGATTPETANLYQKIARQLGAPLSEGEPNPAISVAENTASGAGAKTNANEFLNPLDGNAFLDRLGQKVKAKGEIIKFGTSRSGAHHYINFSENYRSSLSLVLRVEDSPDEFKPEVLQKLISKTVTVEGVVFNNNGAPQIAIKSLSEIKVVDDSKPAAVNR
jgi:WD40 repeat protein/tRNA A-37 threonylcarbamoyl transferase component Bud32